MIPHKILIEADTFYDMAEQLAAEIDDKQGPGDGARFMAGFAVGKLGSRAFLVALLQSNLWERGSVD